MYPAEITLAKLTPEHAKEFYTMRVLAFSRYYERYGIDSCNPERAKSRVLFNGFKTDLDSYYAAWLDDALVGGVYVCPPFIVGTRWVLSSLFVDELYRNRGIARQILRKLEAQSGSDCWQLEVVQEEKHLVDFYASEGYVPNGQSHRAGHSGSIITMQKGKPRSIFRMPERLKDAKWHSTPKLEVPQCQNTNLCDAPIRAIST